MEYEAIIVAIGALLTGILGTKGIERMLTAGADREATRAAAQTQLEMTAQTAIIELAREAIIGWREESKALIRITDTLQQHDVSVSQNYTELRHCQDENGERLLDIDRRLTALVNVLSSQNTAK